MEFREELKSYTQEFEKVLQSFCENLEVEPQVLRDSLRYSLAVGGKRIRPVLFLATLDVLGEDRKEYYDFALAFELIHTYSLIHDDLPAMDNDDFRRGKPSNHKVFGEANAILAGDGLLNTAYSLLFSSAGKGERVLKAAKYLCDAAGIFGMIGGQSADLLYSDKPDMSKDALLFIDERKTARLLQAPIVCAAMIAGKDVRLYEELGFSLGILFQIVDDILDEVGEEEVVGKSLGKDEKAHKLTFPAVYGLEGAREQAVCYAQKARDLLPLCGLDNSFMQGLIGYLLQRNK